MANSWFQFKKFKVEQEKSAMKVGTDGVLLGAWACKNGKSILDVGTGTGLIALMLAQRFEDAEITAIDIDKHAAEQAYENVCNSPWSDRISVECADFNIFRKEQAGCYDHIISNPPYFKQSLKSNSRSRSLARHDMLLTHDMLIVESVRLLNDGGCLSVVLPYVEGSVFIALAATKGLYCTRKTNVYSKPDSEIRRLLLEFRKVKQNLVEDSLVIEEKGRHSYSKEYLELTGPFYLFG
jgi:tRNA1Val (adenine37-N6)-methyltransferase